MEDEKKKICPILTIAGATCQEGQKYCQKEDCEFWCKWTECCALTAIASHLAELRR